jgi:hypothetical protein
MGRLGRFFHDGLKYFGREMKNLQPSAIYHAPDFELLAPFIDALQPATLMETLDQGLASHREAVDTRGHLCGAISGVDVQKKVLTIQPADSRALGQPLSQGYVRAGLSTSPEFRDRLVCRRGARRRAPAPPRWRCAAARGNDRPDGLLVEALTGGAQPR